MFPYLLQNIWLELTTVSYNSYLLLFIDLYYIEIIYNI